MVKQNANLYEYQDAINSLILLKKSHKNKIKKQQNNIKKQQNNIKKKQNNIKKKDCIHNPCMKTTNKSNVDLNGIQHGRWTKSEHEQFVNLYSQYGRDWTTIARILKTRTPEQVRSHAQKFFIKLDKDKNTNNTFKL